jgi:hypothetical protein
MKKHFVLLLTTIVAMVGISSTCGGDPVPDDQGDTDPKIVALHVYNGSSNIVTAKALIDSYTTGDEVVVATCKYENNGFNLTLPKTISDEHLYEIGEFEYETITVSDPKAKVGGIWIEGYNAKDKYIGEFYYYGASSKYYASSGTLYSDRNFTLKGQFNEYGYIFEYNCSFKQGWNILYYVEERFGNKTTVTTQKPADVNMNWMFEESPYYQYAHVNFVKEIYSEDCLRMGLSNYYGTEVSAYFGIESGTAGPYQISPGRYNVVHSDRNWSEIVDIPNYYFEEDFYYSVICTNRDGELYFYVNKDGKGDVGKSFKFNNIVNKLRFLAQKEKVKNSN